MRPDATQIRRLAAERDFLEATVEKALCLLDLSEEIGRHPYLRPRLVLKGGTALNLFYWDCPRLSIDLDLNYIGGLAPEQMQAERPQILRALQTVAEAGGYRVQRGTPHHAAETWYLWYRSVLGPQDHVEIDLNFLMRVCLFEPEERTSALTATSPSVSFQVLALEELMAGKLAALLDRAAPRDLYDTYRFVLADTPYDEARLRRAFVFFAVAGLPLPIFQYDPSRVSRVTDESIETDLWPVLSRGGRPSAADMAELITPLLFRLLTLEPGEHAFANSVFAGHPELEHLFPDDAVLARRSASHPALLWKVQNIRARQGGLDAGTSKT